MIRSVEELYEQELVLIHRRYHFAAQGTGRAVLGTIQGQKGAS